VTSRAACPRSRSVQCACLLNGNHRRPLEVFGRPHSASTSTNSFVGRAQGTKSTRYGVDRKIVTAVGRTNRSHLPALPTDNTSACVPSQSREDPSHVPGARPLDDCVEGLHPLMRSMPHRVRSLSSTTIKIRCDFGGTLMLRTAPIGLTSPLLTSRGRGDSMSRLLG
jgi:hypothetical protein